MYWHGFLDGIAFLSITLVIVAFITMYICLKTDNKK